MSNQQVPDATPGWTQMDGKPAKKSAAKRDRLELPGYMHFSVSPTKKAPPQVAAPAHATAKLTPHLHRSRSPQAIGTLKILASSNTTANTSKPAPQQVPSAADVQPRLHLRIPTTQAEWREHVSEVRKLEDQVSQLQKLLAYASDQRAKDIEWTEAMKREIAQSESPLTPTSPHVTAMVSVADQPRQPTSAELRGLHNALKQWSVSLPSNQLKTFIEDIIEFFGGLVEEPAESLKLGSIGPFEAWFVALQLYHWLHLAVVNQVALSIPGELSAKMLPQPGPPRNELVESWFTAQEPRNPYRAQQTIKEWTLYSILAESVGNKFDGKDPPPGENSDNEDDASDVEAETDN